MLQNFQQFYGNVQNYSKKTTEHSMRNKEGKVK